MSHLRWISWTAVGFVFTLMVWGNLVSSMGSGLACPDWPICHGTLSAPENFELVLEWGHRVLAAITTVLLLGLSYQLMRSVPRSERTIRRSGRVLIFFLTLQILAGFWASLVGLSTTISLALLLTQHGVLSGILLVAVTLTWEDPVVRSAPEKIRRLSTAALWGLLVQLSLGALVRHGYAGLACPNFPSCGSSFFPIPFTFETAVAFTHRWWGVLLLGVYVQLAIAAKKEKPLLRAWIWTLSSLSLLQVVLGVVTVLTSLQTHARTAHAAVAYLLWSMLFLTAIRTGAFRALWNG